MELSSLPTAPPAGANLRVVSYRLYRTATGASGTAYFQVGTDVTIGSGTGTYVDTQTDSELGVELPSALWLPPPSNLQGIVNMANGMSAGFADNVVYFCVPYLPHAWPLAYQYSVDSPIVGIAAISNTLVITTTGRPAVAVGNFPSSITVYPIDTPYPCTSKQGIVSIGSGVLYPSFEGLVFVSGTLPTLATAEIFTRLEWANFFPTTIVAKFFDGKYFGNYTRTDGSVGSFIFSMAQGSRLPIFVETNIFSFAAYSDLISGFYYYVQNNVLLQWDAASQPYSTIDWWSKDYEFPKPLNFGAAKLEATFAADSGQAAMNAAIIAANAALLAALQVPPGQTDTVYGFLGDVEVGSLEVAGDGYGVIGVGASAAIFTMYTNDAVRFVKTVYDNNVFRLPAGYKSDRYSFRISGPLIVHAVLIAETPQGLEKISGA